MLLMLWAACGSSTIVINEIMASNATILADADGSFPDWIELYNTSSAEFPLDGPGNTVVQVDAELDIWFTEFKAVFNLLDRSFTPYAEVGYGWVVVDSNIQDGPADTGCWWDPWWGYMCTSFYDTYESTLNSLTYAVGLRWDISDSSVLKASYGIRELDLDRAEDLEQDVFSVDFACKF